MTHSSFPRHIRPIRRIHLIHAVPGSRRCALALLFCLLSLCGAAAQISTDTPTDFFTNVASRLLRAQLGMDLTNIEVYPTNQYTPAVHRLLQITANLYEATTNRAYATNPVEPYCPTVYRPLFRRTSDGRVIIAGYREVTGTAMASANTAPAMLELDDNPGQTNQVPALGIPFAQPDKLEPMLSGIPLVIGARKGFPNFNEFSMQTAIYLTRLLEFRRAPGSAYGPIVMTNQMFAAAITNIFGLEAWNSYTSAYPRNLQMVLAGNMTATLTNEFGLTLLSNRVYAPVFQTNLNNWPGWTGSVGLGNSCVLPWGASSQVMFLTNSSFHLLGSTNDWGSFGPQTHVFDQGQGLYIPRWYLSINVHLLFILVDTVENRIVDYVNLADALPTVDIMGSLAAGADCSGSASSLMNPLSQWCTNLSAYGLPVGVMNQILLGLGVSPGNPPSLPNINSFSQDPYAGLDAESAIDGFRNNLMGWSPVYPKDLGKVFYKSNAFYVPFDPYTPIYIHTTLQANDPLVHYTAGDLTVISSGFPPNTTVDFVSHNPPLDNLGQVNARYLPWGDSGTLPNLAVDPMDISAKDPLITRSDDWNFPTNQGLGMGWVGRIHRGTPWQTLYLKSPNFLLEKGTAHFEQASQLINWQIWTGDGPLLGYPNNQSVPICDALFTLPTNDWQTAGLLAAWFNTNDIHRLASPNQVSIAAWSALLDGMDVLTNVSYSEQDPLVMSANSPQAATMAAGLLATRAAEPGQVFHSPGDVLATPELSVNSPWLNNPGSNARDEALEIVPSQVLARLRADSAGSINSSGGQWQVQFTGFDGYAYAVQLSPNLLDWTTVSTNYPTNGVFEFEVSPGSGGSPLFYRSRLLP